MSQYEDRYYQVEAVNAIMSQYEQGVNSTLLSMATGTGKTFVICKVVEKFVAQGCRILILAHREELLDQAARQVSSIIGLRCDKEKAEETAVNGYCRVVVGSVQTLMREERLKRFPKNYYDLIVIDEAHHVMADSYRAILNYFDSAKILGVTATPDRGDMKSLGEVFDSLVYEYSLAQAIRDGFLSPILAQTCPLKIDISGAKIQNGDYQAASVGSILDPYLGAIADEMVKHCQGRKTLVFTPLIDTSMKLLEKLQERGMNAVEINGKSPNRQSILRNWDEGAYDYLLNSMLLTEGYDSPHIDCVVPLRLTKIRSLFCLDSKTEILTRDGWKSHVAEGEVVAAFNTATSQIEYKEATASIRRPLNPDEHFVSLSGPSTDIRVTNKHRMLYDHKRKTGWKFIEADKLAVLKDTSYIPVAGNTLAKGVSLTDDELRFIGWVMTDGTINKNTGGITITQGEHQPWCANIDRCLIGCGFKFTKSIRKRTTQFNQTSDCVTWTISKGKPRSTDKHLRGWGSLEPYLSKDFSPLLFDCTEAQFGVLLHAIHLGDGSKQAKTNGWTRRSYHISTGNKTFAERLQVLAIQRGCRCNLSFHSTQNRIWMLHIKKQLWSRVGGTLGDRPSWINEPHTKEECWCVENELGTLVTRRNGKVAIVGNCQMVGRGTRLYPGKDHLLILDFLWNTKKLELVRPASLMAKTEEIAKKMATKLDETNEAFDLTELEEIAESSCLEERERALAKRLEEMKHKKATLVDPIQFELSICSQDLSGYVPTFGWEYKPVTDKQKETLEKFGVNAGMIECAGKASVILDKLSKRRELNLTSPKQIRCLERFGFQHVGTWKFEEANKVISLLAGNGWKVPFDRVNPKSYVPPSMTAPPQPMQHKEAR